MEKNTKKIITLAIALTSVCSIGNISEIKLFEEANAISSVVHVGELQNLSVKTIEGEELDFLSSFDEDDVVEYDSQDKEYNLIIPKNSDGIRISTQVKSDKDRDDENGGKYVVRIFTSNSGDAKPYESGDDIIIYSDNTTIYIRTYKSKKKFNDVYNDDKVTQCIETYKINIKREGSKSDDKEVSSTSVVLPKINVTDIAKSVENKKAWVEKGGYWLFYNENGESLRNQWFKDSNGKWYYFQTNGYMTTGWRFIEGDWYYFDNSGEMSTGWVKTEDGNWYYLMISGKMARNTIIDGYTLNSKGQYVK